jgi:predicted transcriptional regulator
MPARPGLAKSELEVAQIVWRLGKATVREVYEALPENRNLDFKTVQTYLRRLEAKGYVRCAREGRSNVYRAQVRPGSVIRQMIDDFVGRLFGGESFPLVTQLFETSDLTEEEIDRLREMLDQLKARSHERPAE